MSDIFVMIRNQSNVAMTSVDGIAFVTLLTQEGRVLAEETVDLFEADVNFDNLKQGKYTVSRSAKKNKTMLRYIKKGRNLVR
ncbi:hypothetical protein [Microcoleus sp. B4-C1]|uniref:hypothetical protein n=1 Tax=Microcoleus sp. B4-C1 TaxID=2818660 RepID=UPI002FD6F231